MLFSSEVLLSSVFVFIIGHNLAVWANIISLMLLSLNVSKNIHTVVSNLLHGLHNYFTSFCRVINHFIYKIKRTRKFHIHLKIICLFTCLALYYFVFLYAFTDNPIRHSMRWFYNSILI